MYFEDFPKIYYQFTINNREVLKIVTDITANIRLRKELLENVSLYDLYDVKDGETPEIISDKIYGTPRYHWAIMLANMIYDSITEFPMSSNVLDEYTYNKYNKFIATSWYYEVEGGYTYVIATVPEHGISPENVSSTMTNPLLIQDAFVDAVYYVDTEEVLRVHSKATGLDNPLLVDSGVLDENTLKIRVTGPIGSSTMPSSSVNATEIISPSGGLTIFTTNREYLIHHYDLNGYVVYGTPAEIASGAVPVTNKENENNENEAKRRIKIVSPQHIGLVASELQNLIG